MEGFLLYVELNAARRTSGRTQYQVRPVCHKPLDLPYFRQSVLTRTTAFARLRRRTDGVDTSVGEPKEDVDNEEA